MCVRGCVCVCVRVCVCEGVVYATVYACLSSDNVSEGNNNIFFNLKKKPIIQFNTSQFIACNTDRANQYIW